MTGVQSPNILSSKPDRRQNPVPMTIQPRKVMTNPKVGSIDFVR